MIVQSLHAQHCMQQNSAQHAPAGQQCILACSSAIGGRGAASWRQCIVRAPPAHQVRDGDAAQAVRGRKGQQLRRARHGSVRRVHDLAQRAWATGRPSHPHPRMLHYCTRVWSSARVNQVTACSLRPSKFNEGVSTCRVAARQACEVYASLGVARPRQHAARATPAL